MPKRSSKPPSDPVQAAHSIFAQLTGEEPRRVPPPEKDPIAVELGRRGGLKGGKKRMEGLTGEERSELGKLAAQKRWSKETTTEK
jgi:hypothetical protein